MASVSISGTYENLIESGFVRTPPFLAERLSNILSFSGPANVLDPTAGQGDLVAWCNAIPSISLYGVEINANNARVAQENAQWHTLLNAAFESVSIPPKSMSVVLTNPPYFFQEGQRVEARIIIEAGKSLVPGGILVAIIPARAALTHDLVLHLCQWYDQHSVFKFPDTPSYREGSFQKYTQIVFVGVRREHHGPSEKVAKDRLNGFRWLTDEEGEGSWAGKVAPPELPTLQWEHDRKYIVPTVTSQPQLVLKQADKQTLMRGVWQAGAHLSVMFEDATQWSEEHGLGPTLMPYAGESHVAAEVLAGGQLDGEVIVDEQGKSYIFTAYVSRQFVQRKVDEEEKEKLAKQGVVAVAMSETEDIPVLGILDLETGETRYYQQEEAMTALKPFLSIMSQRIVDKFAPKYALNPEPWEIDAVYRIGQSRTLPGAAFPGMSAAQQHAVYGKCRGIDYDGRAIIQGEPGTGKTIIAIGTSAQMAYRWQHRNDALFQGKLLPDWLKGLRRAWLRTPETLAMLGLEQVVLPSQEGERPHSNSKQYRVKKTGAILRPEEVGPEALPVLVTTPKKVTKGYEREIRATYPQAGVMHLLTQQDIVDWMRACAEGRDGKEVIFGILPHSLSTQKNITWSPATLPDGPHTISAYDLEPSQDLIDQGVVEKMQDRRTGLFYYKDTRTGTPLMKETQVWYSTCTTCGRVVESDEGVDTALSLDDDSMDDEERKKLLKDRHNHVDTVMGGNPVDVPEWFEKKQRWCSCQSSAHNEDRRRKHQLFERSPLWQRTRVESAYTRNPQIRYDEWIAIIQQMKTGRTPHAFAALMEYMRTRSTRTRATRLTRIPGGPLKLAVTQKQKEGEAEGEEREKGKEQVVEYGFTLPPTDRFELFKYLYDHFRGCVALTIVDESHNGRGRDTDIGRAHHYAMLAAQAKTLDSATHTGGDLESLFYVLYRFDPDFFRTRGYGWFDVGQAIKDLGVIQQWTKEYESDAHRSSGKRNIKTSVITAPGLSSKVIIGFLRQMVYLTVLDVGAHMPPLVEVPVVVPMYDETLQEPLLQMECQRNELQKSLQETEKAIGLLVKDIRVGDEEQAGDLVALRTRKEAQQQQLEALSQEIGAMARFVRARDLNNAYRAVAAELKLLAESHGAATLAQGTIPALFAALPCERAFTLHATQRDDWGVKRGQVEIFKSPCLEWDYVYPMEHTLRDIVKKELGLHHRVMIYVKQTTERSMPARLTWVLKECGVKCWSLPDKVHPEDRESAIIDAVEAGNHVILVANEKVNEGINLQSAIDTIIWYEMPKNLFALDQASRRAWRLNKTFLPECEEAHREVTIYYLAYAATAGHKKMRKLGQQNGAAALFSGEPIKSQLAKDAGADRSLLAQMSENVREEASNLASVFAARSAERNEALKKGRTFYGVEDRLHARLVARWQQHYEDLRQQELQRLMPVPEPEPIPAPETPVAYRPSPGFTVTVKPFIPEPGPFDYQPAPAPAPAPVIPPAREQELAVQALQETVVEAIQEGTLSPKAKTIVPSFGDIDAIRQYQKQKKGRQQKQQQRTQEQKTQQAQTLWSVASSTSTTFTYTSDLFSSHLGTDKGEEGEIGQTSLF